MGYVVQRLRLGYGRLVARWLWWRLGGTAPGPVAKIGTDYGGWYCMTGALAPGGVALCAGAGEDVSFDVLLNARFGLRVICVDPTPRAIVHVRALLDAAATGTSMPIEGGPASYALAGFDSARFEFVPVALWSADGSLRLYAPRDSRHVSHSATNLQHTTEFIDVPAARLESLLAARSIAGLALLKLDIEGAEYAVIDALLAGPLRPAQLMIEFDELNQPQSFGAGARVARRVRALLATGYRLVHVDGANFLFMRAAGAGR
jgi:FkbM family methyltransferase